MSVSLMSNFEVMCINPDVCPFCRNTNTHCNEYDSDDDLYYMQCDNDECGHMWTVRDDTETWK
jgi:hypothetical protein